MLRGRRGTTGDSAPVPGQRGEPAFHPAAEAFPQAGPATPVDPVNQSVPATRFVPADQAGPANQAGPGNQAGPANQPIPGNQAAPADQPIPGNQAGPGNQAAPADQAAPANQAGPGGQTAPAGAAGGTDSAAGTGAHAREPGSLPHHKIHRTRVSGVWVAILLFAVVLLLLLIFILQNSHTVDVSYFGMHGHLPLGVALLLAAVCGILLLAFAGTARIVQLRSTARKHRRVDANVAPARR